MLPECLSEPIVVPAGGSRADVTEIYLHRQDSERMPLFNPSVDIDGTYRLVWENLLRTYSADRYPFGEELRLEQRVSTRSNCGGSAHGGVATEAGERTLPARGVAVR